VSQPPQAPEPPQPARRPRDRDFAGRPRNARPRDELGRPLHWTAISDAPRIPDDLTVTPAEAAALGGSLLAQDRPFHAHEVFEAAWKSASGSDRGLWRGLAQIAVGLTHARRGNARGAVALLSRGAQQVSDYPGDPRGYGVDAAYVASAAAGIAARIEREGLEAVPAAALRLALRPPGPAGPAG
jgi:uncharacterized protein